MSTSGPENTETRFVPVQTVANGARGLSRTPQQLLNDTDEATIGFLDRAGAGLSILCTIHCVVFPVLTIFLPFLGHLTENSGFHWAMAVLVVPLGLFAFRRGFRLHKKKWIVLTGIVGMVCLVCGLLLPDGSAHSANFMENLGHHSHHGIFNQEAILTLSGSILLAIAHIANLRGTHHDHADQRGHRHGHCDGNC